MINKVCEFCGKTYQSIYSRRNRSRFCSVDCKNASQSQLQIIGSIINRKCKICGKEFNTTNRMNGLKTCSIKCANKARGGNKTINKITVHCNVCGKSLDPQKNEEAKSEHLLLRNAQIVAKISNDSNPERKQEKEFIVVKNAICLIPVAIQKTRFLSG